MRQELNLARKPFLNPRPVLRVTVLLWLLGAVVAAFNARLYVSHYSGTGEIRGRQQMLAESLEREQQQVRELEAELARFDLERQNEQSQFLNAKIAERSFSWSALFDRLSEAMPADVRLTSLTPSFGDESRRTRTETRENEVLLGIRGTARSNEVLLQFVDSLFGHPSFRAPNLTNEKLLDSQLIDFGLGVIYEARPAEPEPEPAVEQAAGEAAATAQTTAETQAASPPSADGRSE